MPADRKTVWPFFPTITMFTHPEARRAPALDDKRVSDLAVIGYPEAGLPDREGRLN